MNKTLAADNESRQQNQFIKHRTICYGLSSVDDIYRLQSAHTENNREPGVHCKIKRHQIMPFVFTGP